MDPNLWNEENNDNPREKCSRTIDHLLSYGSEFLNVKIAQSFFNFVYFINMWVTVTTNIDFVYRWVAHSLTISFGSGSYKHGILVEEKKEENKRCNTIILFVTNFKRRSRGR